MMDIFRIDWKSAVFGGVLGLSLVVTGSSYLDWQFYAVVLPVCSAWNILRASTEERVK